MSEKPTLYLYSGQRRSVTGSRLRSIETDDRAEGFFATQVLCSILTLIRQGINRPGAIARSVDGLTTKVQSDCLRKMVNLGVLEKTVYPEVPPRVEYELTSIGQRFVTILDALAQLQRDID